eukprot:800218-Pelagomonas_calceolata.AAC.3
MHVSLCVHHIYCFLLLLLCAAREGRHRCPLCGQLNLGTHASVQLCALPSHSQLSLAVRSQELGMAGTDACFVASSILDYQPPHCPDIVLALHACDTATDEALALAIKQ